MSACGCQVRTRWTGDWAPTGEQITESAIVYCPLHAAAERMAAFLWDEVMPRYVEMFEAAGLGAPNDSVVVQQARALLKEIGR